MRWVSLELRAQYYASRASASTGRLSQSVSQMGVPALSQWGIRQCRSHPLEPPPSSSTMNLEFPQLSMHSTRSPTPAYRPGQHPFLKIVGPDYGSFAGFDGHALEALRSEHADLGAHAQLQRIQTARAAAAAATAGAAAAPAAGGPPSGVPLRCRHTSCTCERCAYQAHEAGSGEEWRKRVGSVGVVLVRRQMVGWGLRTQCLPGAGPGDSWGWSGAGCGGAGGLDAVGMQAHCGSTAPPGWCSHREQAVFWGPWHCACLQEAGGVGAG